MYQVVSRVLSRILHALFILTLPCLMTTPHNEFCDFSEVLSTDIISSLKRQLKKTRDEMTTQESSPRTQINVNDCFRKVFKF